MNLVLAKKRTWTFFRLGNVQCWKSWVGTNRVCWWTKEESSHRENGEILSCMETKSSIHVEFLVFFTVSLSWCWCNDIVVKFERIYSWQRKSNLFCFFVKVCRTCKYKNFLFHLIYFFLFFDFWHYFISYSNN